MEMSFEGEGNPDFVNDLGVSWWKSKSITAYAKSRGLDNIQGWITDVKGIKSFVLIDTKLNRVVYDNQSAEAVGVKIDLISFLQKNK